MPIFIGDTATNQTYSRDGNGKSLRDDGKDPVCGWIGGENDEKE